MSAIGRFSRRTPKNIRSRRALKKKEAKVFENPKSILFLHGLHTSEAVTEAMVDLRALTQPHCKTLAKKNDFHPFTGVEHLEFLCFKNDCSMFCFGSDNKKRHDNLVFGRHYDFQLLDMIEFGILAMDRLDMKAATGANTCSAGSKPAMIFEGSEFETEPFFQRLKNFFVDFFGGSIESDINIAGVDRAIFVSLRSQDGGAVVAPSSEAIGTRPITEKGNVIVCFRHYGVVQTRTTTSELSNASNIKLIDVGPNFDLEIRRVRWAPPQDFKRACRLPKQALATLKHMQENVSTDALGNLRGHLHVGNQDLTSMSLRKFKATKEIKRKHLNSAAYNITANQAAEAAVAKKRLEAALGDRANRKAVEAAREAINEETDASRPKKRVRRGHAAAQDNLIGADVDI